MKTTLKSTENVYSEEKQNILEMQQTHREQKPKNYSEAKAFPKK